MLGACYCVIVLYVEIKYKFCILFGFFSLYNFEKLGNLNEVTIPEDEKTDSKQVWKVALQSMIIALVYASAIHVLVANFHL